MRKHNALHIVKGSGACCRVCDKHIPLGHEAVRTNGRKEKHLICYECIMQLAEELDYGAKT
jgi:hypothetical protein